MDAKEAEQLVDALASDGKLSVADQTAVLDALASDGNVSKEDVAVIVAMASQDGNLSTAERDIVAEALVSSVAPGDTLTKEQIQDAGIEYKDLPAATPVEVRQDENGNEVIITAEVAVQVELLQDPGALLEEVFTNPAAALDALGSVGADMSDEEREEATEMVVATVVAAGAALNAVGAAAGSTGSTGGSTGGGGSGGGGGGGGSSGESKAMRRRKEAI